MAIVVPIVTEYSDRGLKSAMREIRNADGAFGKLRASASLVGPALAGAAVAAGIFAVKLGVDGVKAAAAEEKELARLDTTLTNLGWQAAAADVDAFTDATARATTFDDSAIRNAFTTIAQTAPTAAAAMATVTTAVDAAEGSGKNLDTVTQALSKAYGGNVTALGKLFPFLDKGRLKTEGMDYATEALNDRFTGQSVAAADTWEGRLGNVAEAFDELKESFGKGFLTALSNAEGTEGGGGVYGLTEALYDLQDPIEDLGTMFGQLVIDLGKVAGFFTTAKTAVGNFWTSLKIPQNIKDDISSFFTSNIFGLLEDFMGKLSSASAAWSDFIRGLTRIPIPGLPSISGSSSRSSSAAAAAYASPTITVNVQAGIGDPVAIARTIEQTLRSARTRTGMPPR